MPYARIVRTARRGREPRAPPVAHTRNPYERGCLQGGVRGTTIFGNAALVAASEYVGGVRRRRQTMADEAYCMKCRQKREFEGQLVTLKNGRPALQGSCPVCGTKLTKILGMDAAKAMGWSAPA